MKKNKAPYSRAGFTLVELSIVLVILGLLVGGVLTGQSLIRAAELRSVTTQYNSYITAVNTFKDKYFALPGDMANAQSFWGIVDPTPVICGFAVGTGTQTCNGNGDGQILHTGQTNEPFRFWQHLANAGLIEGRYSGINGSWSTWHADATNAPTGKISNSLWHVQYYPTLSSYAYMFDGAYNNIFIFGGIVWGDRPQNPIFKPEEAWNIDMKIDDGKPATGKLVVDVYNSSFNTCTTTSSSSTLSANYLLSNTATACSLVFRQIF